VATAPKIFIKKLTVLANTVLPNLISPNSSDPNLSMMLSLPEFHRAKPVYCYTSEMICTGNGTQWP